MSDVTANKGVSSSDPKVMVEAKQEDLAVSPMDVGPPEVPISDERPIVDLEIDGLTGATLLTANESTKLYKAHEDQLDRTIVVKLCTADQGSTAADTFADDRDLIARLSGQSGVVPLLGHGTNAAGQQYQVLPFYPKGSLADLIASQGPLAWREATFLLEPLAVTLAEVYGSGLIHGEVRPSSVLLTNFSLPRLTNFDRPSTVADAEDETVDVFGLAQVLWSLLAGRVAGPEAATAEPTDRTPAPIVDLLRRSLSADKSERPQNAAAFLTELRRSVGQAEAMVPPSANAVVQEDQEGKARSTGPVERPDQRVEKMYVLVLVAMIAAGVLAMVAAAVLTVN